MSNTDCTRCDQPKHRHILDTGVYYCPVARFSYNPPAPDAVRELRGAGAHAYFCDDNDLPRINASREQRIHSLRLMSEWALAEIAKHGEKG